MKTGGVDLVFAHSENKWQVCPLSERYLYFQPAAY